MVLHNPNNWHWVNKDVKGWAQEYLEKELIGLEAEDEGASAKVTKLVSMDGDVDVNQRKGKVITIFDVKLQLEYNGRTAEKEEVIGNITIPEVAHDTAENEYVFEIDAQGDSLSKQPVRQLVRTKIAPQIAARLQQLGPALIQIHGKDIQHSTESGPSSGVTTPKNTSGTQAPKVSEASSSSSASKDKTTQGAVNVTKVVDEDEFRTTASELFQTFTDPQRIAAFTRSPPRVFEGAEKGGKFQLFDGTVSGEYVELSEPTRIVQKWRLAQWPPGHFSTLSIRFDQNDVDGVTKMRVDWTGVPVGQEEVTKRNWREYYVRSIKLTFGFGTIL